MQRPCLAPPLPPFVQGIDVSVHQGDIDWDAVKRSGKRWAIIRSGFGLGADRLFAQNWQGAKAAGVMRGAYHFFLGARDPIAQADLMADTINEAGGLGLLDLPPVLDLERGWQTIDGSEHVASGVAMMDSDEVLRRALVFLERLQKRTHRRPMLYTGEYFHWAASQDNPELAARFAKYPLWLGIAGQTASCVRMPTGPSGQPYPWSKWTIRQYAIGDGGEGIYGRVDLDAFQGTEAAMRRFALLSYRPSALQLGAVAAGLAILGVGAYGWSRTRR